MFLTWAEAYSEENEQLDRFLYDRFRPPMKEAVEAWVATRPLRNADAPPSPFAMSEYRLPEEDEAAALERRATAAVETAKESNQRSDNYVLAVVLFASSLFFAGISTKFTGAWVKVAVLCLGAIVFLATAAWVATFPVTVSI
jgi:hypothetical protein